MARGRKRRRPEGMETERHTGTTETKGWVGDGGTEVGVIDKGFLGDGENGVQWGTKMEKGDGGLVSASRDGETLQLNEGEDNGEEEKGFVGGENGELECEVSIQSPSRSLRKKAKVSYNDKVYEFDEDDVVEIPFKKPGRRGRKKKEFSSNRIVSEDDEKVSPVEEEYGVRGKKSGVSGSRRGRKRGGSHALRKEFVVEPEGDKKINKLDPEVRIGSL